MNELTTEQIPQTTAAERKDVVDQLNTAETLDRAERKGIIDQLTKANETSRAELLKLGDKGGFTVVPPTNLTINNITRVNEKVPYAPKVDIFNRPIVNLEDTRQASVTIRLSKSGRTDKIIVLDEQGNEIRLVTHASLGVDPDKGFVVLKLEILAPKIELVD